MRCICDYNDYGWSSNYKQNFGAYPRYLHGTKIHTTEPITIQNNFKGTRATAIWLSTACNKGNPFNFPYVCHFQTLYGNDSEAEFDVPGGANDAFAVGYVEAENDRACIQNIYLGRRTNDLPWPIIKSFYKMSDMESFGFDNCGTIDSIRDILESTNMRSEFL